MGDLKKDGIKKENAEKPMMEEQVVERLRQYIEKIYEMQINKVEEKEEEEHG